jgi:putative transposase
MTLFNNRYRIQSHRFPGWDYAQNGYYFITINTQNRICYLGHIENQKMVLSAFGEIVEMEWKRSFEMRDELILDEWVLMPNHIHAIVIINAGENNKTVGVYDKTVGAYKTVETHGRASLQQSQQSQQFQQSQPPSHCIRAPKSLSSFMAGFKSSVNSKIDNYIDAHSLNIEKFNTHNHFFQPNYHDRIIRTETEYHRIKTYIQHNPLHWEEENHPKDI